MEIDVEKFEGEIKFAFRECYSNEFIEMMSSKSGGLDIVETMYQAFASGYYAALAEHYKGEYNVG